MNEIWVPMDSGVIMVDRDDKGDLKITDQMLMEKKPINGATGFAGAYKPKPKKGGK